METINVSLSSAFHNKQPKPGYTPAAFADSFHAVTITPRQLFDHAASGGALALGVFQDNRRARETFVNAQLLALDFDAGTLDAATAAALPFVQAHGAFVYPSASSTPEHPKTRVVFVLSEPVTDAARFEALLRGLIAHFADWQPDPACKDAPRFFYGSDVPGALYIGKTLDIQTAGGLTAPEAAQDAARATMRQQEQPRRPVDAASSRAEVYSRAAIDRITGDYLAVPGGAGLRHDAFISMAAQLVGMAKGNWPGCENVNADIEALGRQTERGAKEIADAIAWAWVNADARALELPEQPPLKAASKKPLVEKVKPVDLPTLDAGLTVSLPYVSTLNLEELETRFTGGLMSGRAALLVKSPIGTGKTELINRLIEYLERRAGRSVSVLLITHRRALGRKTAARLNLVWHRDIPGESGISAASAPQLAITYDSLWRVAGNTYDLVIIDELAQVHPHTEAGTMRGGEPKRNYSALKTVVQVAGLFVGLDAHLTDIAGRWTRQLRPDLLTITNEHRRERGVLTLHSSRETIIGRAVQLIAQNAGYVAIPTSSKRESEIIFAALAEQFGADAGRLINSDNSESAAVQQFLQDIETELPRLKFLVYSPSLGTGVDIQARARGVLGVFYQQPLSPADMLQMMGRCRNAEERAAYVQNADGSRETDPAALYTQGIQNARHTARLAAFEAHHLAADDDMLKGIHRLLSEYSAERNRAMNAPLSFFAALAEAEGYRIEYHDGENRALRDMLKATKERLAEEHKSLVLTSAPVDHDDYEQVQRAGGLTPEIRAGHERFKIEDTVGLTISPAIYDDLHSSAARARLRRFADLWDDLDSLGAADRQDAADGVLYSKRTHRLAQRRFFEAVCKLAFDCAPDELPERVKDMPADELARRAAPLLDTFQPQLVNLLGYRPGVHSARPIPVIRFILARFGVKLTSQKASKKNEDGGQPMVYGVDISRWDVWRAYAAARLNHLAEKRRQAGDRKILQTEVNQDFSIGSSARHRPPGAGWQLVETGADVLARVKERAPMSIGKGASKHNPFSLPAAG